MHSQTISTADLISLKIAGQLKSILQWPSRANEYYLCQNGIIKLDTLKKIELQTPFYHECELGTINAVAIHQKMNVRGFITWAMFGY